MNTGSRTYELLIENAPDATIMIDAEGIIRYVNLQAERLFLYNREELIDRPLEVLLPGRYRAVHQTHRANYAKAPRLRMMGVHIKHLAGLCKDGREFPAEISLSPLPDGYVLAGVRERLSGRLEEGVLSGRFLRAFVASLVFNLVFGLVVLFYMLSRLSNS